MIYLLDTHIVVWLAQGSPKLKQYVIDILENPSYRIKFSAVNLWEVAVKQSIQKSKPLHQRRIEDEIKVDINRLHEQLLLNGFEELPVFTSHAKQVKTLPFHHRDPFDRLLIAQAMVENICLITHDDMIWKYKNLQILKA